MEETDWDAFGTGNYAKCANCMVHSGFEATAVNDTVARPWKALGVTLRGMKTDGPMAPEIPLDRQRPPEFVFQHNVSRKLSEMRQAEAREKAGKATTAA